MDRQTQTAARQLFAAVQTLDLRLPKQVEAARGQLDAVRLAVENIPPHDREGVARAVADALIEGADPLTDPGVARAIQHAAITQPSTLDGVETSALMRLWEAVNEHSDEMVDAMRKPFDKAAEVLVAAHEQIGDLDLKADSEAILKKGGGIASAYTGAVEASEAINAVTLAWSMLDNLAGTSQVDPRWVALRITNPQAGKFDELELERKSLAPYEAVRLGLPLSLPTLPEYTQRRAAITEYRAQVARNQEQARRDQSHNFHNLSMQRIR